MAIEPPISVSATLACPWCQEPITITVTVTDRALVKQVVGCEACGAINQVTVGASSGR